jgi:multidrug efflux pump subunit AcrA (membrane-fusion protein)
MAGEHHEPDGIAEQIEDLLRSGLLLSTRLAERRVRAREQALRDAARDSLDRAQAERDRQRLERQHALAQLEGVFSGSWWEHASAEDIRRAWTIARSYQHEDAHAARGVWQIADHLKARYGLDPFHIDPEAFGTRAELEPRTPITDEELARYDRQLARLRAQLDGDERVPQDGLAEEHLRSRRAEIDEIRDLIAAERRATISETPEQRRSRELRELGDVALAIGGADDLAAPGYDTRERRALLAEHLAALEVDAEAVRAAILADAANAQPPEMAAATEPRPAPQARVSSQARHGRRQARRPR